MYIEVSKENMYDLLQINTSKLARIAPRWVNKCTYYLKKRVEWRHKVNDTINKCVISTTNKCALMNSYFGIH